MVGLLVTPWAFWAMNLVRSERFVGYWVLPLVLALTFLSGHPQEWLITSRRWQLPQDWVVIDALRSRFRSGGVRVGALRILVWGGLLGVSLCLCAVELLPELAVQPWLLKTSKISRLWQVDQVLRAPVQSFSATEPVRGAGRPGDYAGPHDNCWETVLSKWGWGRWFWRSWALCGNAGDRGSTAYWLALVVVSVVFAAGRKLPALLDRVSGPARNGSIPCSIAKLVPREPGSRRSGRSGGS